MGADLASENDPSNHHKSGDAHDFHIPSPRPAPDDDIAGLPETPSEELPEAGSGDPVWWYDQPRKRGSDRRYWGHVERIGGAEGDQLRQDLAAAIRDLLDWANRQIKKSDTDSDTDSDEDGESR